MNEVLIWLMLNIILAKWVILAGCAMGLAVGIGIIHDVWVKEAHWPWLVIAIGLLMLVGFGIYAVAWMEWRN